MKNNQKNSFLWGNYDYSNISTELNKKIPILNNQNKNQYSEIDNHDKEDESKSIPEIKNKIISPIKSKLKEGVSKISSSKIITSISSKFSKAPIHSENPSGLVMNKENSLDIISKIEEKENYMKKLEKKENSEYLEDEYIEHDEETGLPIVSEYQLNCIIDDFKDRVVGKERIIFYKIEIFSSLSGKRWDIYHGFSEFYNLYLVYKKFFLDIPDINFGKYSPNIVEKPIEHRELISKLNLFINGIIKKPALITSCYVINFLKLENHFPDISIYKPLLLYDSKEDQMNVSVFNSNKLSINAIYYIKEPKLLLIGTGLNEESMYNRVKNKINKLFKSQDPTFGTYNSNNICKGQFIIYNIINNNNGEVMFVELKCIDVISEIIKFDFWPKKNYVTLSLKNGQILIFKIFINESSSITKEIIEYIGTINEHFSRPLCCIINFDCGYTYSFGQYEKSIKICDLNYQNLVKEVDIFKNKKSKGFIWVDYTISLECVYLQDDNGSIYFIDIISDYSNPYIIQEFPKFLPNETNSLEEKDTGKIIQIRNSYYLLIGGINKNKKNKECLLSIYLIQMNNFYYIDDDNAKINLVKLREIYLGGHVSITDANINNNEDIIISLSNGSICIYNRNYSYPEYIIDAHLKYIPGFIWIEDKKMIITASQDKTIKLYQFPPKWPAEFLRKNKQVNDLSIIKEIKYETKNLFEELSISNSSFYNPEKNYEKKKEEKNENNDDIKYDNNQIVKDFWKIKENIDNKNEEIIKDNTKFDVDFEEEQKLSEIIYDKPEKYETYNIIFSDDLNGWSKVNE